MTDIASFRQAHFYEGNENYVSALPCSDFRTLLTTRRHQQEIYCRYYSGARVVRELSFAQFCEARSASLGGCMTPTGSEPAIGFWSRWRIPR
jgi:hypothetical protein